MFRAGIRYRVGGKQMPKDDDEVWTIAMFDLPVGTKTQRRKATEFRNYLLDLGFWRAQYSVYAHYLPTSNATVNLVRAIKSALPPEGEVRIVTITDKQWSKGLRFSNRVETYSEDAPTLFTLF